MSTWTIGDIKVRRLREQEPLWDGTLILGDATTDRVKGEGEWLLPFIDELGRFRLSIHALLVESEGRRILVDTCVGNDKPRPGFQEWNEQHLPFLSDLEKAGVAAESIDYVISTHLHLDHVGWNTVLVNGRWVPTFPKARYLLVKREWEHWSKYDGSADFKNPIEDSVRPVIEAGQAQFVEPGYRITSEVWLDSTPGHTPGHTSIRLSSRGDDAVITGDMIHHPIQVAHLDWVCGFDHEPALGNETRRHFVERYADQPVLILGTHFAGPTGGHIVRRNGSFRFEA